MKYPPTERENLKLKLEAGNLSEEESKERLKRVDSDLLKLVQLADEFWATEQKERVKRLDSLKADASSGRNELYQLVGLYAVFLSVFFSSASQTNNLRCPASFLLVFLTLAVTIFTSIAFFSKADSNHKLQLKIADLSDIHTVCANQTFVFDVI